MTYLVRARQAEGVEHAVVFLREEGVVVRWREQGIAGADVDAAAGHRWPRPDRTEFDLLEYRPRVRIQGDQLAAGDSCKKDHSIGKGDPRGHRVAYVPIRRLRLWPADRCDL